MPPISTGGHRLGVSVSVLLYEYRAKIVLLSLKRWSMRTSVAWLFCVRLFVNAKLLASPPLVGSGYSAIYFTAMGSKRLAGITLPANGVRDRRVGS